MHGDLFERLSQLIWTDYYAGLAHYSLGNKESVKQYLGFTLHLDRKFCVNDGNNGFYRSEHDCMQDTLDIL